MVMLELLAATPVYPQNERMSAYTQNRFSGSRLIFLVLLAICLASTASAAPCVNKFTHRSRGSQHTLTLLTGKLTFQDAQALAAAIHDKKAAPIEWVDAKGKNVSTQFGDLKIIRPMPVACDGNPSGVIMMADFPTLQQPGKTIRIKFDAKTTVDFEEQTE
jgi:hypothetical protein